MSNLSHCQVIKLTLLCHNDIITLTDESFWVILCLSWWATRFQPLRQCPFRHLELEAHAAARLYYVMDLTVWAIPGSWESLLDKSLSSPLVLLQSTSRSGQLCWSQLVWPSFLCLVSLGHIWLLVFDFCSFCSPPPDPCWWSSLWSNPCPALLIPNLIRLDGVMMLGGMLCSRL
jgi:hypothetical protein